MQSGEGVQPVEEAHSPAHQPTIYDVATACGVAPSTVSRAFSRPGRVAANTAARIRRVAEELGYRTTPLVRAPPKERTSLLAIVIADLTNPYFFEVLRGAEETAATAGYTLLVADLHGSAAAEQRALDRTLPMVDGVVFADSRMSDSSIRVTAKQCPTVVLNRSMSDVSSLTTDNAAGMRGAVGHLKALGHTTITYLSGPEGSWVNGVRWQALREASEAVSIRARRMGPFTPTESGGVSAAEDFLETQSTAVIAYNDSLAVGFMRALAQLGVSVPHNVSVVGFDDLFGTDFCTPQLTTVASPLRRLGNVAIQILVRELRNQAPLPNGPLKTALLPSRLLVRSSTAVADRPFEP